MILLTGAAGKTGKAVLKNLVSAGAKVRVLTHTPEQAQILQKMGAMEALPGDIHDTSVLQRIVKGIYKVYHICPNVSPDEFEIGRDLINTARNAGVSHFVYHSVLHPQVEAMPHHWQKMRVEEYLFASGMDFSVVQPCAYMQNILTGWNKIVETGVYSVPYSTSARISVVDLEDVGRAAAKVLVDDRYKNGVFECCGPQALSQEEVAGVIGDVLQRPVFASRENLQSWEEKVKRSGMDKYQVDTLVKMFDYYDKYSLVGNSWVLECILGTYSRTLKEFFTWYNQNSTGTN